MSEFGLKRKGRERSFYWTSLIVLPLGVPKKKKTGFSLWVIYLCFHKGNVLHLDGISGKFYYASRIN